MSSFTFNPTMSLYIPRVYKNITASFIIDVFEDKIKFGKILTVHMKKNTQCKNNNSAIIHFESWNETIVTTNFQTKIHKQNFARVVHDDPWFWIVLENNSQIVHPEKDQDPYVIQYSSAVRDKDLVKDYSVSKDYSMSKKYAYDADVKNYDYNRSQFKYQEIDLFEIINGIVYHHHRVRKN